MRNVIILRLILTSCLLAFSLPFRAQPAQAQPSVTSGQPRLFRDMGYSDLTAHSMYGSLDFFFPVPKGYVPVEGSKIEFVFSHSPLLVPDRSTLTVVANGQSLTSIHLTKENEDHASISVKLPVKDFKGTAYFVQVQFSMRLTHDECEETQNPALWSTIHGDSALTLPMKLANKGPGLDDLNSLFTPSGSTPLTPTLVLPKDPQPEEIEAAGLLALQVGRWAAPVHLDPRIRLAQDDIDTLSPDGPSVIVGSSDNWAASKAFGPVKWVDGITMTVKGKPVPEGQGLLAVDRSDPIHLLVTGSDPKAVLQAADAIVQPERRALLAGDHTILTDVPVMRPEWPAWQEGAASFAQLGVEKQRVGGPGEHILEYIFERPAGWVLKGGSTIDLAVEASTAMRPDTSWVGLMINGLEIGTQKLLSGDGLEHRYKFNLPVDLLNSGLTGQPLRRLALQVRLYLDLPQVGCTQSSPGSTWAAVLPTSAWLLPHSNYDGLDLGRFPAPLTDRSTDNKENKDKDSTSQDADSRSILVVMPEKPNAEDLSVGLNVMAALGRWAVEPLWVFPKLITADRLSEQDRQERDLILIGGPERNSVSKAASSVAPNLFKAINPAAYRFDEQERRSVLRMARSPWAKEGGSILAITGDTGGLDLGAEALQRGALLFQLQGESAIIAEGLPPQTLSSANPPPAPPASLAPRVETPLTERLPTWQVVGAILLGAFIAIVFVWIFLRLRRSPRKQQKGLGA